MKESCYWLLSQDWSFCFLPPGGYSNVKIFGYAEFLASLAILAVIFTLVGNAKTLALPSQFQRKRFVSQSPWE